MKNIDFLWGKMQQRAFCIKDEICANIKNAICANPPVQAYSLQKEATDTTDASEKDIGGFFCKKDIQSYMYRES